MRVYRRSKWDVTHSLTPKPEFKVNHNDSTYDIPELPERRAFPSVSNRQFSTNAQRSRKHRLIEQRNTEIEKRNRLLYEKIRKIMQKGHSSERKIQPSIEEEENTTHSQFLNTAMKPLSLPQVRTSVVNSLRSTQSELTNILHDRSKYAEKYFEDLRKARENMKNVHTEQIGDFVCFGWKVKVLLMEHGQYVVLRAKKGKKQLTKKYIYEKVQQRMDGRLEEWVSAKFQFEI